VDQLIEFTNNHAALVASFVALLGFLFFTEFRVMTQKFSVVTPSGAIQIMNQDGSLLIDVRETKEISEAAIADYKHIPLASFSDKVSELEKYKDKDIIVYCRSGHRSASACRTLTNNGFESVYNLKGGIMAWQDAQLPVVRGK